MGSDEMLRMVSVINDSANKVYHLLENLLEWSLIQRNMINVYPGLISLKKISQAGLETMKDFALVKKIGLTCMVPEDMMVYTDEKMLVGTLRNLVSNALKFTPSGGAVTVSARILSEDEVEVWVKDTGIGMQKSLIDDLFKPGAHTSRPGTEGEPSSGLGLVLCKEFVEKNGGKIRVESEPGNGTTFYFTIPKNNPRSTNVENVQQAATRETKKQAGLKILLAEDDVASKLFLTRVLKDFSREIIQVNNGTEAIKMCRLHPDIDLVLMDILMPEMDGYDATREIRKFNKEVIIIVQSTVIHVDGSNRAIDAGCNDFVSKPISFKKLKTLIEKYFPNI
jgi:CheY-like chemotaxis protein/anti-sigma regulatory factor (Ser/Thr protein kinase)